MQDRRSRERRSTARSRTLKVAKVILGTSSAIDCVVRNVTNTGARIHIPNTVDLPEAFDLTRSKAVIHFEAAEWYGG